MVAVVNSHYAELQYIKEKIKAVTLQHFTLGHTVNAKLRAVHVLLVGLASVAQCAALSGSATLDAFSSLVYELRLEKIKASRLVT